MVLNLPGSLFEDRNITTVGYRSPESGQNEIFITARLEDANFLLVFTVPAGKTFFLSTLTTSTTTQGLMRVATGEAASEVAVVQWELVANAIQIGNFNVPMVFASGTKISVSGVATSFFTLIGWTE